MSVDMKANVFNSIEHDTYIDVSTTSLNIVFVDHLFDSTYARWRTTVSYVDALCTLTLMSHGATVVTIEIMYVTSHYVTGGC